MKAVISAEGIEPLIFLIRGQKVVLDADLANLYGVSTKRMKEQVRRNMNRFPPDFMFTLTKQEVTILRSQFATSSSSWGGSRYQSMVFTEHGAIMTANVLRSETAIEASIYVVRAFADCERCWQPTKNWPIGSWNWTDGYPGTTCTSED